MSLPPPIPHLLSAAEVAVWFGPHAGDTPCRASSVRDPSLLWFNDAVADGLPALRDLDPAARRRRVLEDCAWHAQVDGWEDSATSGTLPVGVADRYGGSGIGTNGGSGRAWYVAGYHVKGIGRTPLIGRGVDAAHASGGAYLEEIVRETIFAELHRLEFPHGAVPMLAIIDLGVDVVWKTVHGDKRERQVLAVRPAMLRPAHFERALQHASSQTFGGAVDAERVTARIERLLALLPPTAIEAGLRTWATGWAEQIGYGYVHRLAHGGLSTSNVTWSGALLDFGACSAMPDWRAYLLNDNGRRFEPSSDVVTAALESLATSWYFATDALPVARETLQKIAADARVALARRVLREARRLDGDLPSQAHEAVAALDDAACLHCLDTLFANRLYPHAFPALGERRGEDWASALPSLVDAPQADALRQARAKFIARPRPQLHREAMRDRLHAAVDRLDAHGRIDPDSVTRFIANEVAKHRRDAGEMPLDARPVGFVHGAAGTGTLVRQGVALWLVLDPPWRPESAKLDSAPERRWYAVEAVGPDRVRLQRALEPTDFEVVRHQEE